MAAPRLTRFGNPILRQKSQILSSSQIKSADVQSCIAKLREGIQTKQYGVGLAAPQIGESLRVAVIDIKPTKLRPNVEPLAMTIINPEYSGIGRRNSMWEGCLSTGAGKNTLYAKALRYKKIQATWHDELGKKHSKVLTGLPAHVFQHETDHLNGVLFVDLVRDTKTFMLVDEYKKRILKK